MTMPSEEITTGVIGFFIVKEIWSLLRKKFTDDNKEEKEMLKANTKAQTECTIAIVKLQVQIEMLLKAVEFLPQMQKDISNAHEKIRSMRPQ